MSTLDKISAGDNVPDEVNVVIEVPRGKRLRYEYDPSLNTFRLAAILDPYYAWPTDYGFVPSTVSQDGQPLDALVMTEEPTFPDCVVTVRPVGVLNLTDGERLDHKILTIPVTNPRLTKILDLEDVPQGARDKIEAFFHANPDLSGTHEEITGWEDAKAAKDLVFKAWEGFLL